MKKFDKKEDKLNEKIEREKEDVEREKEDVKEKYSEIKEIREEASEKDKEIQEKMSMPLTEENKESLEDLQKDKEKLVEKYNDTKEELEEEAEDLIKEKEDEIEAEIEKDEIEIEESEERLKMTEKLNQMLSGMQRQRKKILSARRNYEKKNNIDPDYEYEEIEKSIIKKFEKISNQMKEKVKGAGEEELTLINEQFIELKNNAKEIASSFNAELKKIEEEEERVKEAQLEKIAILMNKSINHVRQLTNAEDEGQIRNRLNELKKKKEEEIKKEEEKLKELKESKGKNSIVISNSIISGKFDDKDENPDATFGEDMKGLKKDLNKVVKVENYIMSTNEKLQENEEETEKKIEKLKEDAENKINKGIEKMSQSLSKIDKKIEKEKNEEKVNALKSIKNDMESDFS